MDNILISVFLWDIDQFADIRQDSHQVINTTALVSEINTEGYWEMTHTYPDNKVHGANMGPTWGQQDPSGPHVGHVNLAICV